MARPTRIRRLDLTPEEQRTRRMQTLNAFVDANLLYPASTRDEIPTISVAVADPGHFSAFGKSMTPHEFLLHDEVHRSWLGNDAHGPLVLDIVDPSPAATALAQRLSNVSGADIIVPMADAPTQWQILHPTYGGAHPSGTVELSSDGTMVLLQGTERRAVQPEDLGQLLGVGVSKTAFRLYDKVLVIHRRDSDPQIVNANNPIKRQLDAVDMLRRWGAPYIASTAGRTEILGLDATLMDFYPGHSIEAGHETPSGEMFYATDVSLINENSLSSLLEMRNFYTRMGVGVDDPQFPGTSSPTRAWCRRRRSRSRRCPELMADVPGHLRSEPRSGWRAAVPAQPLDQHGSSAATRQRRCGQRVRAAPPPRPDLPPDPRAASQPGGRRLLRARRRVRRR